ncbi:MAG: radical SAM protein [Defluviitaleaceae bacterium]|nr:radical SAM protein [Defluviitaleaceae bacterium]
MPSEDKIYCVMAGHRYVNEVQTVAQIFFRYAGFAFETKDVFECDSLRECVATRGTERFHLTCTSNPREDHPRMIRNRSAESSVPRAATHPRSESHAGFPAKIKLLTCVGKGLTCEGKGNACAAIYIDGKNVAEYSIPLNEQNMVTAGLSPRRVLMLTLFHALQKVVPTDAPWGALTGIRPSKMVRAWLDEGKKDEDIIDILINTLCVREDKAHLALTVAHAENRLTERIYSLGGEGSASAKPPMSRESSSSVKPPISGEGSTSAKLPINGKESTLVKPPISGEDLTSAKPPLGIYIGIPFCPSRCSYCSFNIGQKPPTKDIIKLYVNTLIRECREKEAETRRLGGRIFSIYIGGGTPTILPDDLLSHLLDAVGECFGTPHEYTVEAGRPDTLTENNLRLMRSHGVNRIAVNPQTLNDHTLATIGRNHTTTNFFRAFSLARNAGFDCINVDLIAGLPGETDDDVERSLDDLLSLKPENITLHALSIKRASKMNEERITNAFSAVKKAGNAAEARTTGAGGDSGERLRLQERRIPKGFGPSSGIPSRAGITLASAGYSPYYLYRQKNTINLLENVGYSFPNRECLYNIGMMSEVQTILGIGAGAVSKYVQGTKISRTFNEKNPEIYVNRRNQTI